MDKNFLKMFTFTHVHTQRKTTIQKLSGWAALIVVSCKVKRKLGQESCNAQYCMQYSIQRHMAKAHRISDRVDLPGKSNDSQVSLL